MNKPIFTMMVGLPGSGKSTYAENLSKEHNAREKDKENGEKTRQKYKKLWGEELYNNVMSLHEADVRAH